MKAVVHSAMSVMDVTLALLACITELSTVRVSGSSCDGFKEFKFFGENFLNKLGWEFVDRIHQCVGGLG